MSNIITALSAQYPPEDRVTSSHATLGVTELRLRQSTGTIEIRHLGLAFPQVKQWLQDREAGNGESGSVTILRLIWLELGDKPMQTKAPQGVLSQVLDGIGLREAYQYCSSHFTGVAEILSQLPKSTKAGDRTFTFSYHPKLTMLWSHTASELPGTPHGQTNALLLATADQIRSMKALLGMPWSLDIASHTMFPLLLCSVVFSREIYSTQDGIKMDVREVEVRTGYHRFANRREQPATGELGNLSARMSGCETKLASVTRKLRTLEELCGFMDRYVGIDGEMQQHHRTEEEESRTPQSPSKGDEGGGRWILASDIRLLRDRVRMQTVDNDYIKQRVRIQIEALFNLIAQHDSLISLKIAQSSQLSAVSSQYDSFSMRVMAVVAMFFLPGTFVSGLFSVDFFDWNASTSPNPFSVTVSPAFGLYCAVVIALTVLVFVIYILWLGIYRLREKKRGGRMEWGGTQLVPLEEVRVLSMRRESLYEKP